MTVWDSLIGQDHVVGLLKRAVVDAEEMQRGGSGPAMTHAWLLTGPPGSGRSTVATAFAAALNCPEGGCGVCTVCRTVPKGSFPDVDVVRPEKLSYGVDDAHELVRRASMAPGFGPWHVIVLEDADRLTVEAANSLLKAIEEPPPSTVWILCAPSAEDVLPTIRSRTRHLVLGTPSTADVALALETTYGIDKSMAAFAARASQGHIGRARALASDEAVRMRRAEVLRIPSRLGDLASCFAAASDLLAAATEDAKAITDPLDTKEDAELLEAYGVEGGGRTKGMSGATTRELKSGQKNLAALHKSRATRVIRDQVDRALVDLLGLYRDVLALQIGSDVQLINQELVNQLTALASASPASDTARRLESIAKARQAVAAAVNLQLLLESLMVELKSPGI